MITKELYPKGFELFKSYVRNKSKSSTNKQISDEVLDTIINDTTIRLSLLTFTRDLYDFFDAQGTIVCVWNIGQGWKWKVSDSFSVESSALSRMDAEKAAFIEAFNRLEKK